MKDTRRPDVPPHWDTLGKRLQWVIDNRKAVVDSAEDWVRKASATAGTPISRQLIASIKGRATGSMRLDYAAMLVAVPGINIDLTWLATGRGDPSAGSRAPVDLNHERRRGAEFARADGVPETVVQAIRSDPSFNTPAHRSWKAARWHREMLRAAYALALQPANERSGAPDKADAG